MRGRPPKGDQAMTSAERKRGQRERDARAVAEVVGNEQTAPLRVLLGILSRVDDSDGASHSAQRAWAEIGRRYGFAKVMQELDAADTPSRYRE